MTTTFVKKAKKTLIAALTCAGLSTTCLNVQAAGVPVIDATAIAQAIQQLLMLQQQYDQLVRHLNQLERTHENFTGNRGFASTLSDIRQYDFVTRSIATDFENIRTTGFNALSGEAQQIYQQSGAGVRCTSLIGKSKERCEREVAMAAYRRATWRQSQRSSQEHMRNINELRALINSATDAKGIAEVQARISNEQNALATEQARLDAVEREFEAEVRMAELEHRAEISTSMQMNDDLRRKVLFD